MYLVAAILGSKSDLVYPTAGDLKVMADETGTDILMTTALRSPEPREKKLEEIKNLVAKRGVEENLRDLVNAPREGWYAMYEKEREVVVWLLEYLKENHPLEPLTQSLQRDVERWESIRDLWICD